MKITKPTNVTGGESAAFFYALTFSVRTNQDMTTELITTQNQMLPAYQKINDPMAWCSEIGKSLHVTFGLTSPHHGTIMALTMLAENISPTIYNKRYHGDGSMRASSIQAVFLERGGKIEWINIGDEGAAAIAKFSHPVNQPTPMEISYTIGDATKQVGDKISKPGSNWATNPGAMLRAALIRKAIKIIDPGIIGGYDDFSEFDDQKPDQQPAKPARKSRDDRAKELAGESVAVVVNNDIATATVVDDVIDVEPEPKAATVETPPIEASEPTAAQEDDGELPTTPELNQEILALGKKIPNKDNPGTPYTLPEIAAIICKACKVDAVPKATRYQIRTLIERWRNALGGK